MDQFAQSSQDVSKRIADTRAGTAAAAGQYAAEGAKRRDTRVTNEANAAQSQRDAEAWQNSPWAKRLQPRPGTPTRFNGGNFNAGIAGGYAP